MLEERRSSVCKIPECQAMTTRELVHNASFVPSIGPYFGSPSTCLPEKKRGGRGGCWSDLRLSRVLKFAWDGVWVGEDLGRNKNDYGYI